MQKYQSDPRTMHSLSLHIRKGGFYNGFAINNIILDLTSQNSRRSKKLDNKAQEQ